MFFNADERALPHHPFKAIVSPRPIAWVSTRAGGVDNLGVFSFYNAIADIPPMVMFIAVPGRKQKPKDTLVNVRESGAFCVNHVSEELAQLANQSAGAYEIGVDEFSVAGIDKAECNLIDCPRVGNAAASLECELYDTVELPGNNVMVMGSVKGVHVDEAYLTEDGLFDIAKAKPVTRLGYNDWSITDSVFELRIPKLTPEEKRGEPAPETPAE